jgi:hypothetical protein
MMFAAPSDLFSQAFKLLSMRKACAVGSRRQKVTSLHRKASPFPSFEFFFAFSNSLTSLTLTTALK